jgi:RNA polymerase sigma-70 factor, ECF subfamily
MPHADEPPSATADPGLADPSESALRSAVAAGDQAAAQVMVERYYPIVIRTVRSHLPRRDDEEDVAQEVFMKIFSRLHQYRGPQPFGHWVSRIALFACYDRLRYHRRRPTLRMADFSNDEAAFIANALSDTGSDEATTHGEDRHELLAKLLDLLNATERVIIQKLDLDQCSVAEIADQTGWGASKIKVTALRARRKLATALQKLELHPTP